MSGIVLLAYTSIKIMNKKILFSGLLVIFAILAFAFVPKINSCNTDDKTDKAVLTEKPANEKEGIKFVEETWCGPCRMLKSNTFPDKIAGEFFNKNFINVALDMEKGDGLAVAATYQVNAYPTLIITDADGNLVTYTKGYIDAKQPVEFGKHGLSKVKK